MLKSYLLSGVAQGPDNKLQVIEIVPPNTPFYGFAIDWLFPREATIRYGQNEKTGLALPVGEGSRLFHQTAERGGLYLLIGNGVEVSIQSVSKNPLARVLVALAPVSGADVELGSIWDRARNVQAEVELTAGAGNKATIRLNNFTPDFQDDPANAALFPIGRWGKRVMRVNSLLIESSITGRVTLGWVGALDGNQGGTIHVLPLPLGSLDTPGGCVPSANDAAVVIAEVLAHPIVTAGQNTGLSDLAWTVLPAWCLAIQDDSLASTLFVAANYDVARLNPEDP